MQNMREHTPPPCTYEIDYRDGTVEVFKAYDDGGILGVIKSYAESNGYTIREVHKKKSIRGDRRFVESLTEQALNVGGSTQAEVWKQISESTRAAADLCLGLQRAIPYLDDDAILVIVRQYFAARWGVGA